MEWGFFEIFAAGLAAFYALVKSYGFAIILLTLLVRVILLPLSIKQTRSMREMAVIQPELKKIQQKHKGDRQKLNEETMKLYKEHGVNPFGGCLPLLMQFPVLIALFYVIRSPLNYMSENWALARDLGEHALSVNRFLGLRLDCFPSDVLSGEPSATISTACGSGVVSFLPYLAMILGMGFTTYYQQKQMQASRGTQDSPQAQQMQMFARIMPFMLMLFAFNFPTGVVLYWLTTNLWTIVQQRIILKAAPIPVPGQKPAGSKGAAPAAKGGTKTAPKGGTSKPAGKPKGGSPPEAETAPTAKPRPHPSSKKKKRR
jgi:YidC/Oxa1 family membrane protein insertase